MFTYIGAPWLISILTQLVAEDGVLDTLKIHLFKNDVEISPGVLVSSLVEADYSGYAASAAIVWGAPFLDASGRGKVVAPTKQFTPTSSTIQNTIYGFWLMPTVASTTPVIIVKFDEPVEMVGVTSACFVTPEFIVRQP